MGLFLLPIWESWGPANIRLIRSHRKARSLARPINDNESRAKNKGSMKAIELQILESLERMAASCPWEGCDIWVRREPEGAVKFTAYAGGNSQLGIEATFGYGLTPAEAVENALKQPRTHDPKKRIEEKIAELRAQIFKLEAVEIGDPPYRPGYHLGPGAPEPAMTEAPRKPEGVINV